MINTASSDGDSIVLIGMPGAGKSTLGVLLAKALAKRFVDSDLLIQERVQMSLQDYLDRRGYLKLRDVEAEVLKELPLENTVLATGGSAVYSSEAMLALKRFGKVVYLSLSYEEIARRVQDAESRGLASPPGTTLKQIYEERLPLYDAAGDLRINLNGTTMSEALRVLLNQLS